MIKGNLSCKIDFYSLSNWNTYFMVLYLCIVTVNSYSSACLSCSFRLRISPLWCSAKWYFVFRADHIQCTCSGLSDKLHLLLSLVVFSYKVKVCAPTHGWFALSSKSESFHCYFCFSSAEVSVCLEILVMIFTFIWGVG